MNADSSDIADPVWNIRAAPGLAIFIN